MGDVRQLVFEHSRRSMFLFGEWERLKREHADESAAMAAYHLLCDQQTRQWRREDERRITA